MMGRLYVWELSTNAVIAEMKEFRKWLDKYHRILTRCGIVYLTVIEKGKVGGRLHIHQLVNKYKNWNCVKAVWETITEGRGCHVFMEPLRVSMSKNTAYYFAKYATKTSLLGRGGRCLIMSKGYSKKIDEYLDTMYNDVEEKRNKIEQKIMMWRKVKDDGCGIT